MVRVPDVDRVVYNADMQRSGTHSERQTPAKERILLAAHALFYGDGIRATGVDRVIAEAGVTKVTFYRHFPSKNGLVLAFLEYRHEHWMAWFAAALERHGGSVGALVPTLAEWFASADFRGCAFINSVGELGDALPEVRELARRHKQNMTDAIEKLLPPSAMREQYAQAIAVAVDGAIVRAQLGQTDAALQALDILLGTFSAE